jgi:hypothetical protein
LYSACWRCLAALALFALCAGAGQAGTEPGKLLRQILDEKTALTITGLKAPLVLAKAEPQLGVNARDYVQVAPLEINRQGQLRYYLWMGFWSTVSHASVDLLSQRFERIYLFADGEPMELVMTTATTSEEAGAKQLYRKPVDAGLDAYYAVTADQLGRIGAAKEIYLVSARDEHARYDAWEWNADALTAFAAYAEDRELR